MFQPRWVDPAEAKRRAEVIISSSIGLNLRLIFPVSSVTKLIENSPPFFIEKEVLYAPDLYRTQCRSWRKGFKKKQNKLVRSIVLKPASILQFPVQHDNI